MNIVFSYNFHLEKNKNYVFFLTKEFITKNNDDLLKLSNFDGTFGKIKLNNGDVFIGLGEEKDINDIKLQKLGNKIFDFLKSLNLNNFIFIYNNFYSSNNDLLFVSSNNDILFNILQGVELSDYSFNKYFSEEKKEELKNPIESLSLIINKNSNIEDKYKEFSLIKENMFLCKDLVNEPSNVINPESYSELLRDFTKYGLEVEILNEEEMKKLGMGCLLAVGQGSVFESKLVILKWKGLDKFEKPLAFVGKGITFDSGGIDIKPDNSMYDMKCDMSGSAVVVSTLKLLAQRKAKVNAVGIVALVENMPDGKAVKPADIVKSMSGQTVEILHTDAEGRLILADALYYAAIKFNPEFIIDTATLTGAICVALGEFKAGLFSNNNDLVKNFEIAEKNTGEEVWRMPLSKIGEDYDLLMNSKVADIKNISGIKYGGAITAAQFLQRFINSHTKWAHLDIAATAFPTSNKYFTKANFATGYGVRLFNDIVKQYEK